MIRKFLLALLVLVFASSGAALADQWIHVKVENPAEDERVTVNLPMSLLHAAAALIPEEMNHHDAHVSIDQLGMDWKDLLAFWDEVKAAPEATFVTVETGDEKVKVRKEGEYVLVKTVEHGENGAEVDVKFPLAVVDALLSGPEGTLDFEAALNALAAYGPGHLVSVRDGEESVRIWIDDRNEAE